MSCAPFCECPRVKMPHLGRTRLAVLSVRFSQSFYISQLPLPGAFDGLICLRMRGSVYIAGIIISPLRFFCMSPCVCHHGVACLRCGRLRKPNWGFGTLPCRWSHWRSGQWSPRSDMPTVGLDTQPCVFHRRGVGPRLRHTHNLFRGLDRQLFGYRIGDSNLHGHNCKPNKVSLHTASRVSWCGTWSTWRA